MLFAFPPFSLDKLITDKYMYNITAFFLVTEQA